MTTPTYQGTTCLVTVARLQFDPIRTDSIKYVQYMKAFYDQLKKDAIKFDVITYRLKDGMCVGLVALGSGVKLTRVTDILSVWR